MPVKIKKKGSQYQVSTPSMIHAKGTTKDKAKAQMRLLNAIEHNPDFRNKMREKGIGGGIAG